MPRVVDLKLRFLIFLLLFGLIGCSSSPSRPQILINGVAKDWIAWQCNDFVTSWEKILTAGYMPNDVSNGTIFLGDTVINATHTLEGIHHNWYWNNNRYQIVIESDGTGYYYDFTGTKYGQTVKPSEMYSFKKKRY